MFFSYFFNPNLSVLHMNLSKTAFRNSFKTSYGLVGKEMDLRKSKKNKEKKITLIILIVLAFK